MSAYQLIPITSDIAVPPRNATIDSFMDTVDADYLAQFGYTKDQVRQKMTLFSPPRRILGNIHEEHNLGDILRTPMCTPWRTPPTMTAFR